MARILFVHGVSHVELEDPTWVDEWQGVLAPALRGTELVPGHVDYDDLFNIPLSPATKNTQPGPRRSAKPRSIISAARPA